MTEQIKKLYFQAPSGRGNYWIVSYKKEKKIHPNYYHTCRVRIFNQFLVICYNECSIYELTFDFKPSKFHAPS